MNDLWIEIGKLWLESIGRKRTTQRYAFAADQILTPGYEIRVSELWNAIYVNLHPTHYAVAIAPDGRIMHLRGGYNRLSPGRYILHYVDKQNRVMVVPRTAETTLDGSQLSLELVITYRVIDPIKALEVQQAVDILLVFIQSDLKEFVRSNKYDQILGWLEGGKIDNERIARYIKDRHASRHQMSKLFFIADAVVNEMLVDPPVTDIREKYQTHQKQSAAQSEMQRKNQELEKKGAAQDRVITQIEAASEPDQQEIVQGMQIEKNIPADATAYKKGNSASEVSKRKKSKVFISYSRNDLNVASEIYEYLRDQECIPWMDKYDLIPGQDWQLEIQKNIRNSDFFIACLSNHSVSKAGFVQKELKEALTVLDEMPIGHIYLIPIRIDDCIVPVSLASKHWLDWSSPDARKFLLRAITSKATSI